MIAPLLALRGISKRFDQVVALDRVDLDVAAGTVHAVLGENGAGKSTLMKVIYGLVAPDAGELRLGGAAARFRSALDARRAGIGMVHQEFALVDALTVAENLALTLSPPGARLWRRAPVVAAAQRLAAAIGLDLGDLDARVGTLPVGLRQRIEIVKALAGDTRILILDEPTAVLTPDEVGTLFAVLDRLRRQGTAVLFITHKLHEVVAIADRVTVMRRGRVVAEAERRDLSEASLAELMVGPLAASPERPAGPAADRAPQLVLERVSACDDRGLTALRDVSLAVRGGEVFGIAGVEGNGQQELFEVLTGLRRASAGRVAIDGTSVPRGTPAAMIAAGVACVPPDRQRQGVVPAMSVQENAVLNARLLHACAGPLLTDLAAQRAAASEMIAAYAIKAGSLDAPVRGLSGGNLQKLIVARAMATAPRVLVAANPARGLDIAAARAVYAAFDAALARGAAVLLIASDLDEIVAHCDRLAVLYRGRLSGALERPFPLDRIAAVLTGGDAP